MTNCPAWTSYVNTVELCDTVVSTIFIDGLWIYSEPYGYGVITADTNHPSYDVNWFTFYPGDILYIVTESIVESYNLHIMDTTGTYYYLIWESVPYQTNKQLKSYTFPSGEPPFVLDKILTSDQSPGDYYFNLYDVFSDNGGASSGELADPQLMYVSPSPI